MPLELSHLEPSKQQLSLFKGIGSSLKCITVYSSNPKPLRRGEILHGGSIQLSPSLEHQYNTLPREPIIPSTTSGDKHPTTTPHIKTIQSKP